MIQNIRPLVEYNVCPDRLTIFDCRWNTPRRMGIGDRLIVCAAIQHVSWNSWRGGINTNIGAMCHDRDKEMFSLAGIPTYDQFPDAAWVVPWRDHVMCVPIGMVLADCEKADAEARHPVERALWGIGLDQYAEATPELRLEVTNKKKGATLLWSPVEISRDYFRIEAAEWITILEAELARNPDVQTIELYCAINDQPRAFDILRNLPVELAKRIHIRSALTLSAWVDACASARTVITAHNGCLWVAIGAGAAIHAVQREPHIPHHAMWAVKPGWGLGRLRVSTLPGMGPKAAPRIAQAGLSPCPP